MIIAVDTGGTKTLIASFDAKGNKQIISKFPTPRDQTEYIETVVSHVKSGLSDSPLKAISIAVAGPIKHGVLLRSPNIGWENFDVKEAIGQFFPDTTIYIGNDADMAAVGESHQLPEHELSLYITMSTGVGTGLTFNKRLLPALERFEGGSMRVVYENNLQRWEDIASGKNFYERYGKYGSEIDDPAIWNDYAERAAVGFQLLIPLLEPDYVVVGGSMGTHFAKYADRLQVLLDERIAKHMPAVRIVQANNPEEAVIDGCYYFAIDNLVS